MLALQEATFGRSWPSKLGLPVHAFTELYFTPYRVKVTAVQDSFRIFLQPCLEDTVFPLSMWLNQPKIIFWGKL
jgi:hypothetical protein